MPVPTVYTRAAISNGYFFVPAQSEHARFEAAPELPRAFQFFHVYLSASPFRGPPVFGVIIRRQFLRHAKRLQVARLII